MLGRVESPVVAMLGKYQLIRKLATGGMAEVYLAKVAGPGGFEKTLVLKRVLPHLAEDENFLKMFLSEAKLAAQLSHPNVVSIFDFGQEGETWFLVMEFIDGPNLRSLYRRAFELGQPPAFNLAAKIISAACEGLAYAHEFVDPETGVPLELVHRDISPDNILLGRNGGVKVVDFGIAKAANQTHHTKTGTIKGKFSYMPPEQLRGQQLDRRSDVFALGIVLYELICGGKPFDTSTDATIMQGILFEPFRPASDRRPDTPAELQRILDRALAKDREARYADCRELQADLDEFIVSQGASVGQHQLAQLVARLANPDAPALATPSPRPSQPNLPRAP
ncbi:MAG: pkn6, partial [Myxococcaceae bacterium]|nr:pkn6 [Myxococcaceae bacterium]